LRRVRGRGWCVAAASTAVVTTAWLAAELPAARAVGDLVAVCIAVFAAVTCLVAAQRAIDSWRLFWLLFAVNFGMVAFGRTVWDIMQLGFGVDTPNNPLVGLPYVGGLGCSLVALLTLPGAPTTARQRLRLVMDGVIVGAALLLFCWPTVFYTAADTPKPLLVALIFPLLEIVTFTVILLIAAEGRGAYWRTFALVCVGLAARAIGDTWYVQQAREGTYHAGSLVDAGSILFCACVALAARCELRPAGSPVSRLPGISRLRVLLPTAVILVAAILAGPPPADPPPLLVVSFAVLFALMLLRQAWVVLENSALTERLARLAYHDSLTGLPNRALLAEGLDAALATATRPGQVVVLMIDVDGFKRVNDSLGHAAGDRLLSAVAHRLRSVLRPGELMVRVGGDEFATLVTDAAGVADGAMVAERLLAALAAPLEFEGRSFQIGVSIGVAGWTGPARDGDDLLRNADVAMYAAKADGRARFRVYEPGMTRAAVARAELESDLRLALERDEFELCYQPIVDLRTGVMQGFEALLRWKHPIRGLVSPCDFVPLAEETGAIGAIDRWVLGEACREAVRWQRLRPGLGVSVNFSAGQFARGDLMETVTDALLRAGLPPSRLTLEVTETSLINDAETTVSRLAALSALGIRIAIDDFGTGYSSLAYLRRLPVSLIKIDKVFVDGLGTDPEAEPLVQAIMALAASFNLATVAEGVETDRQREVLCSLGCTAAQGYLFARPLYPAAVDALLIASAPIPVVPPPLAARAADAVPAESVPADVGLPAVIDLA
jgi:diguanylate cyclase (GGDEF)-like protein